MPLGKNFNYFQEFLPNNDDTSSFLSNHMDLRKSVNRRKTRLKSAHIYSQKIKMYNPNMLIFTPNNPVPQNNQANVQPLSRSSLHIVP